MKTKQELLSPAKIAEKRIKYFRKFMSKNKLILILLVCSIGGCSPEIIPGRVYCEQQCQKKFGPASGVDFVGATTGDCYCR